MKRTSARQSHENAATVDDLKLESAREQSCEPGLYILATPIGNARDVTLRALDVLKACDLIAAEDTRVTSKLLSIYHLSKPLVAYNDHNGARERPRLIARLQGGARIALVSDAGTPLISDPGYKLVREAVAWGISVHTLPGPSAALAALTLSGLPTDRFLFAGFLPAKGGERRRVLEELRGLRATLIFFESPQRIGESLADIATVLDGRQAAVAREITKLHEEVRRGGVAELAKEYASASPKGEIVVVVGPPAEAIPDFSKAEDLLKKALMFMPSSAAADLVSEALDLPRREIYQRTLAMKAGV